VALVNYLSGGRSESMSREPPHALAAATSIDTESTANPAALEPALQSDAPNKEVRPPALAAETFDKLASAAIGDDARARAAAIDALADAPKAQAVGVLQRVLSDGIEGDRQLALNSLRTLAVNQGDAEGEIRNVLRLTIYDGDDETVASSAQVLLDDIERNLTPAH
jgi:hypothetical protein